MASRVPTVAGDHAALTSSDSDPGEVELRRSIARPRRAWAAAAALAAAGAALALLLVAAPGRAVRSTSSSGEALIAEAEQPPERKALVMIPAKEKEVEASESSKTPNTAEEKEVEASG